MSWIECPVCEKEFYAHTFNGQCECGNGYSYDEYEYFDGDKSDWQGFYEWSSYGDDEQN